MNCILHLILKSHSTGRGGKLTFAPPPGSEMSNDVIDSDDIVPESKTFLQLMQDFVEHFALVSIAIWRLI